MRRHWSGFTPKSHFTQHNFHYTCNLVLHKALWRIQSSFLFLFWMVGKSICITRKTLTTLSLYCAFRNLDSCWTLYIEGTCLSITHCKCTESLALRQVLAPPWAAPLVNWTTPFLRLRSCLVRIFHLASFRDRFSICLFHQSHTSSSLQPTPHLFSVNLVPLQNIARVHPLRFSDLANSFF